MAIGANSYGDPAHIAKLTPQIANSSKVFSATTNPTLDTVENEVDYISGFLNAILASRGFDIPITQADAKAMLDLFVNRMVAEIVKAMRGGGRLGPLVKEGRKSLDHFLMSDIIEYIDQVADGLQTMGATRSKSTVGDGLSFRDEDDGGNDIVPLFQRAAFGATFEDWDT